MNNKLLFRTSRLTKSYRSIDISDGDTDSPKPHGVQFGEISIPRGGIIAIVGESGTGKTTLFNLLAGLDEPDRRGVPSPPEIELNIHGDAIDIVAHPKAFPREHVGFVFQSGFLLRNASTGLNLMLPLAQQGIRAEREALQQQLTSLGIADDEDIDERAWKFSGGEAQRIAFVRSVAHDPQLVFADEPTSNVDLRKAASIMEKLRKWVCDPRGAGRTVLWITHDLRLAAAIADGVIVLHRGGHDPLHPVCLPGDPEVAADLQEREATLDRWSYDKVAMDADAPVRFEGLSGSDDPPVKPSSRGLWQRARVQFGAVIKVGLSEVFSRHSAQRLAGVRERVNPALSVADGSPPRLRDLWAWLWSFGQWSSVLALGLIIVLGTAGLAILSMVDAHFERSINDPRTCHIMVKTSREQQGRDGYGDLDFLSERPWIEARGPTGIQTKTPDESAEFDQFGDVDWVPEIPAPATCESGPAAYGRIFARGWGIAMAAGEVCPTSVESQVLFLTADAKEPIWSKVKLLADSGNWDGASVRDFFDSQKAGHNHQIFLTARKLTELGAKDPVDYLDRTVCLFGSGWANPVPLQIRGVIDEVPNWKRNAFSGFIPRYTYDAFNLKLGDRLLNKPTDIALYFSLENADALQEFLNEWDYTFVTEDLEKIRRLVKTANIFKGIVSGFLGLVGLLLIVLTMISVLSYLNVNAQSFALLKAFGMPWHFMLGTLVVEITAGWLLAAGLVGASLLTLDLLVGNEWWRFDELVLSSDRAWPPFLAAAGSVWVVSVGVSLMVTLWWWRQNRYVAQVLKLG